MCVSLFVGLHPMCWQTLSSQWFLLAWKAPQAVCVRRSGFPSNGVGPAEVKAAGSAWLASCALEARVVCVRACALASPLLLSADGRCSLCVLLFEL